MSSRYILLIGVFYSICNLFADQQRFHQTLEHYYNYALTYEKRSIVFNYETNNNPDMQRVFDTDTTQFREKYRQFALSFDLEKKLSNISREQSKVFKAGFNSIYEYSQNLPTSSLFYLDTLHYLLELYGKFDFAASRYRLRKSGIKTPFIQIQSSINTRAYYAKKKGFDPDLESPDITISDVFKRDWIVSRRQHATLFIDLSPGAGIGKQVNVLPLYQVFKLEKELIKKDVAHFPLSEKTLLAIAELLAENNSYSFRRLEKTKKFKKQIDSIIVEDEAVEKSTLRYISPLDIKKILLCNAPLFTAKPRMRFFTTSRMIPRIDRKDIRYPYDVSDIYDDTRSTAFTFRYEHLLGIDASWGIPLTHNCFLSLYGVRNLLATDREIDFLQGANHVNWDEVLDIRLDMLTSLWVTNWLMLQTGCNNIPSWLGVPRRLPYHSFFNTTLFIEDYLALSATLSYYASGALYTPYVKWSDPILRQREGLIVRVTVQYNF